MVASWEWALFFVFLAMSAFFSSSETALMSLNKVRVHHLVEKGRPRAYLISELVSRPNRLLSTILVGNNIVNIAASSLATSISLKVFGSEGVGIAVAVVTVLILVFGEITPKTFAAVNSEKVAAKVALPIYWLQKIFFPVIKLLGVVTNLLIGMLGGPQAGQGAHITEEEIRIMVDLGEGEGAIESQEREMIDNVFELNDLTVREVMVPRVDIVAVEADSPLQDAWGKVVRYGHSRLPVYQGSLDNIIGILYAKDLMARHHQLNEFTTQSLMREAYHVPETKHVDDLLREMRKARVHIAVVLDEFGGTSGFAFLEDLVETIIGEIGDEYDERRLLVENLRPGQIRVSGGVSVEEVNEITGLDLPQEDFDTIGGLVFHMLGRVPEKGDSIEFGSSTITVDRIEGKRIRNILITKKQ